MRTQTGNIKNRLHEIGIDDDEIDKSQQAIDRNIQRMDDSINYIGELARGDVETVDELDLAERVREDARFLSISVGRRASNWLCARPKLSLLG